MLGTAVALTAGPLTASPAVAAYSVGISFPGGNTEFYSPFAGPATIQFDFDAGDLSQVFRVRVRPVGGPVFVTRYFSINPTTQTSPQTRVVSWDDLATSTDEPYEVLVNPDGQPIVAQAAFILRPRLASVVSAAPSPFFPWIDDGYRDTTNVGFSLVADADVQARVSRPNFGGRCCGARVRNVDLGNLSAGNHGWVWDGRHDTGDNLAKGDYFVRIWADDAVVDPVLSRAKKVTIARTYRVTRTKAKKATAYHHVGRVTPLVLGGDCIVYPSDDLQVLCQGGRVSVYWRWGLSAAERIERASFVLNSSDACPRSIRRIGHTRYESFFTMNEDLVGAAGDCHLATAKITYSYPQAS